MELTLLNHINDKNRIIILDNIDQYNKNYLLFKFAKDTTTGLFILPTSYDPFNHKLICPNTDCNKKVMCCSRKKTEYENTVFFKHYPSKEKNECQNFMLKPIEPEIKKLSNGYIKDALQKIHNKAIAIIINYLLAKKTIIINKICDFNYSMCDTIKLHNIFLEDGDIVKKEYSFKWENNDYRADIAILDKKHNLKYIIEVAHTHLTQEHKRPNNIFWCEISATSVCNKVIDRQVTANRTDFNPEEDNHTISYSCLKTVYCNGCHQENLRLKIIDDQKAIEKLQKIKEIEDEKEKQIAKEIKHKKLVEKTLKKIIIEKKLICNWCNNDIVSEGYKWLHIDIDYKFEKSNIVICKCCYNSPYICKIQDLNPELYQKECQRILDLD